MDEDEDNKWLFYNFATNEYEIVEGEEHGVSKFVAIDENDLWYVSDNGSTLYKYDMKTKTVSIILDHIDSVAVATNTGFAAYIKDTANRKKIHLYDISRKKQTVLRQEAGIFIMVICMIKNADGVMMEDSFFICSIFQRFLVQEI